MKTALVDTSVWLALSSEKHLHFKQAQTWFNSAGSREANFCRITQMSFLRLLANSVVVDADLSTEEVWNIYRSLLTDPRVGYLQEPPGIENSWVQFVPHKPSGSSWTDAYLAAFAFEAGLQFVTFDQGFRKFQGLNYHIIG